jgi:hypothetical protein
MDAFEILVVVLSSLLALFLALSIVVVVFAVKLVKNLKEISDKAVVLVNDASSVAATMKKGCGTSCSSSLYCRASEPRY